MNAATMTAGQIEDFQHASAGECSPGELDSAPELLEAGLVTVESDWTGAKKLALTDLGCDVHFELARLGKLAA